MRTRKNRSVQPRILSIPGPSPRLRVVGDDSPASLYLGRWLSHRAARHRALLANIIAAQQLRPASVVARH